MKRKLLSCMSMAAMALALATPAAVAQNQGAKMGRMEQGEKNERHPEIRKAIRALEQAKDHMQKASHDFGGHRAEALEACDNAIKQLKLALQYDKK